MSIKNKRVNSRFRRVFLQGLKGKNIGLPTGMPNLDKHTGGILNETYRIVMGGSGTGKTTFVNYTHVVVPYLAWKNKKLPDTLKKTTLKWIYFSYEISYEKTMFSFLAYFMKYEFNLEYFILDGTAYDISAKYLLGQLKDKKGNLIKVNKDHIDKIAILLEKYLYELFGDDENDGLIDFYDTPTTAEGVEDIINTYASENGDIIRIEKDKDDPFEEGTKYYTKNDPDKRVIVIMDHMRKVKGTVQKQAVDEISEVFLRVRNLYKYSIVALLHINRSSTDLALKKFMKDKIFPTQGAAKSSGNPFEDCDGFIALFNPNDLEFNLKTHFGVTIRIDGHIVNNKHRTAHILKERWGEFPKHISFDILGAHMEIREKSLVN